MAIMSGVSNNFDSHSREGEVRASIVRRCFGAAVIAGMAIGANTLAAPVASASSVITRPTSYVWSDPNALAECQAQGKWEVANNGWDGYACHPDPAVSPTAVQLWVIIWVGCPTC